MKRLAIGLLALLAPVALLAQKTKGKGFPHETHAELFDSCAECHSGITKADAATMFPKLETCAACHDKGVRWTPPGKGPTGWLKFSHTRHAEIVGTEATCKTCHTSGAPADSTKITRPTPDRCESCHDKHLSETNVCSNCHEPLSKAVGISLKRIAAFPKPATHFQGFFTQAHGAQAGADKAQCQTCHVENFCSNCHAGEKNTRRYHPANFAERHGPEAYSRTTECSGCHSTEAFCRSCHAQAGRAATTGARNGRYHNAEPQWLLKHGTAARQQLTTCVTCHQQSYCMQCHSNVGWRVSPHGPDFDAATMQKRNAALCLRCHIRDPLRRN